MQSRDESHRSPVRSVEHAWRLVAAASLGLVLTSGASAAEKASPSKKSKAASAATAEKGVETLAEIARRSVVEITHFGRDGREDGVGAGFVVSSNGLIATSLHVIGEARPVQVQLADGKRYEVTEVHAWDRQLDLAVIRVDAAGLPALPLGDSDALKQGTPVVAMGNPLGLEHSIVQGVVSAKREFDGVEMIQLAIPVEPGNSGGPLLDLQGRVQGIITLKAMSANLGFAMPINALKPLCIYMHVGEQDPEWLVPMQRQSQMLREKGLRVRFSIEPDQGHGIQTLAGNGAHRLFDQLEEGARGCN